MATSNVNETAGSDHGMGLPTVGGTACEAHDLKRILGLLADQIADADRRHSNALATMQERLGALGSAAQGLREQLPEQLTPVMDRIESGMAQLSDRIAESSAQRPAAPAAIESASQNEAAPALRSALAAGALDMFARRTQPARGNAPIDHFDVVDSGSSPKDEAAWDREAAEALASIYEADAPQPDEPATDRDVEDTPAATVAQTEVEPIEAALAKLAPEVAAPAPVAANVDPAAFAAEVAALQAKGFESERQWLDQRLVDIAGRLEQSLASISRTEPLDTLDQRFALLESKLAEALGDNAKSADLAGLKGIESQVEDLSAQLVSVQTHFSRLDTIELELRSLADRMSSEGFARMLEGNASQAPDNEALAGAVASRVVKEMPRIESTLQTIAAQLSADKIAGLIAQSKSSEPDAGAIARLVADHVSQRFPQPSADSGSALPQLEELREMIQTLAEERRHGEEQTSTMLDTMQQAMIRLLDRMDSIEHSQFTDPDRAAAHQPDYPETHRHRDTEAAEERTPAAISSRERGAAPELRIEPAAVPYQPGHYAAEPARSLESAVPATAAVAAATAARAEAQHAASGEQPHKPGSREDYVAAARRAARMAADSQAAADQAEPAQDATPPQARVKPARAAGGRQLSKAAMAMICLILVGASFFIMKSTLLAPPRPQQPAVQSQAPANATQQPRTPAERSLQNLEDADQVPLDDEKKAAERRGESPQQRRSDVMSHGGGRDYAQVFDGALESAVPAAQVQGQPGFPPAVPMALTREDATSAGGPGAKPALPLTIGPNSLRTAATKGDPSAEFEIGARFAEGRGVTQDLQQAVVWYSRSAAQGFAPAQYRLGSMYERGLGVKPDMARARVWYGRAAEQGIVKAMHNLAVLTAGRDASVTDYATAAKWFLAAAEHGLTDSQFNLAIMHDSGLGMERDSKQALKWFTLAARAGDDEAARRRESLRQKLQPQEIAQVEAEITAWRPKTADHNVNDARLAGEAWKARAR